MSDEFWVIGVITPKEGGGDYDRNAQYMPEALWRLLNNCDGWLIARGQSLKRFLGGSNPDPRSSRPGLGPDHLDLNIIYSYCTVILSPYLGWPPEGPGGGGGGAEFTHP